MGVINTTHTHPIYPTRRIEPWLKEKELRNQENHLAEKTHARARKSTRRKTSRRRKATAAM